MNLKLTDKSQDLLIKAAVFVILYLIFAKPVFNWLGITKSKNDRIREKEISSNDSPFMGDFYKKRNVTFSAARKPFIIDAGLNIHKAMGVFSDDEDLIIKSFKQLKTQAEVSKVAEAIEVATKKDLLTWLMKGQDIMPQNGISDYDLGIVISYVKNLKVK